MEANPLKRSITVNIARTVKRPRLSGSCGSDSESVHSVQNHDTEAAKDTSDTSIDSDMTEYEVARLSPQRPNPFFSTDDSDEINEINEIAELGAVVAAATVDLGAIDIDVGQLADTSTEMSTSPTSNSDVDPELPRQDYLAFWTCTQCKAVNENRHVPFCSACYTMRKNFFPPRPTRRRPRGLPCSQPSEPSGSQGIEGSQGQSVDSGVDVASGSQVSSFDGDVVDGPSKPTPSSDTSLMCQTCLERPADGLFVHGRSAHRYCCYSCAKVTWRRLGQCPLCRRQIVRVLKLL